MLRQYEEIGENIWSKRPLTQAKRKCNEGLKPGSLQRIQNLSNFAELSTYKHYLAFLEKSLTEPFLRK